MRNSFLHLDNFTESVISFSKYQQNTFDSEDSYYKRMVYSLRNIMEGELTNKQKMCVFLYYEKKMKMKVIAEELGIGVSSVSRHIKRARSKIERTMRYYFD